MNFTEFLFGELITSPVLGLALALVFALLLLLLWLLRRRRLAAIQPLAASDVVVDKPTASSSGTAPDEQEVPTLQPQPHPEEPVRELKNAAPASSGMLVKEIDQLIDIEESLMALRELYHRQLITPEVYVNESKKIATRLLKPE